MTTAPMPLERWLRELQTAAPPSFLLGGTGHLILTSTEKEVVRQRLQTEILPRIKAACGDCMLLILTGLAPGSDQLFSHTAVAYAREHAIHHRLIGLLPLPIAVMLDDWADKMRTEGHSITQSQRTKQLADMEAERVACDRVVHLMPPSTSEACIQKHSFRNLQYQRLAACLAEQSDALIAILRADSVVQSGGTAEVVKWRQAPSAVPSEISTLPLRRPVGTHHDLLFVIDPELAEQTT